MSLRMQLIRHEGLRLKPYRDTVGKLTIGVGRNLDDVGISEAEAFYLLENDIKRTRKELHERLPWISNLSPTRQDVLVNMAFNMGVGGVLKFKKMLANLEQGRWYDASREMLDSKWAQQVGERAVELAEKMRNGI